MTQNEASYFQPHQVGDRTVKTGRPAREPAKLSSDISQGSQGSQGTGDTSMESNSSSCKAGSTKKPKQKRLSLKVWSKVNALFSLSEDSEKSH